MPRSASRTAFAALALMAACGGRSTLPVGDAPAEGAGVGGGSSSSSSSASSSASSGAGLAGGGGQGGSSGPPPACVLSVSGAQRTFHNTWPPHGAFRPRLAPVGDAQSGAALTFRWGDSLVAHFVFDPWGVWPTDSIGEPYGIANLEDPDRYAVAGAAGGQFAVLLGGPAFVFFGVSLALVTPNQSGFVNASSTLGDPAAPGQPLFAVYGGDHHLVGFQQQLPGGAWSSTVGTVAANAFSPVDAVSCSDAPIAMGAVRNGDAYLVATSSAPLSPAECATAGAPPVELRLLRYQPPSQLDAIAVLSETAPVRQVAIAAHADGGGWLVWQRRNGEEPLEVMGARVDAVGTIGAPFSIAPVGQVTGPFAVTGLGDRLVIAWVDHRGEATPTIALRVHAQNAEPVALSFTPDAATVASGELSLLPSPTQTAFLLAWASAPIDPELVPGLDVARFDCVRP